MAPWLRPLLLGTKTRREAKGRRKRRGREGKRKKGGEEEETEKWLLRKGVRKRMREGEMEEGRNGGRN